MRLLVAAGVALTAAALIAVGVAARGPDQSACGEVGDRERVSSPDGSRSVFVRCSEDGSAWLYVAEGDAERRLVPARFGCCYRPSARVAFRSPAWSPDGERLAVVIEDVGGADVWAIDVDGRAARRLTSGPARERAPRWSADGRRIRFETETGVPVSVAVAAR
jgi:Tol biopolymer transport system component